MAFVECRSRCRCHKSDQYHQNYIPHYAETTGAIVFRREDAIPECEETCRDQSQGNFDPVPRDIRYEVHKLVWEQNHRCVYRDIWH